MKEARERLAELEERLRYTLDTPEAQEALREAREELARAEKMYQAEQRRQAAVEATRERKRKEREEARRRAGEEARKQLPEALTEVEQVAAEFWRVLGTFVSQVMPLVEEAEKLADELYQKEVTAQKLAEEAGELVPHGYSWKPSPALAELLKVTAAKGAKADPIPVETRERLAWCVEQLASVGARDVQSALSEPMGFGSLAKAKELEERRRQEEEARRAALEAQRRAAEELQKERDEFLVAAIAKHKERLLSEARALYTPQDVKRMMHTIESRAADLAREEWVALLKERAKKEVTDDAE